MRVLLMGPYHEGEREVQRRAGVLLNADRIGRGIHREIPELARRFAAERRFLLLGAADARGRVWATVLQGRPGFLSAPAEDRLHVAARPWPGDPLAETLEEPADVGTLLIDPPTRRRVRLNGRAHPDGAGGLIIEAREVYANCPQYIRPREVGLPEPASVQAERGERLTAEQQAWLAGADTLFLATRHPTAGADVSHRGGEPGFARVPESGRVLIPDYAGNMMFNSLGNIAADGRAGLLLVDFGSGRTLQLTGTAAISWDDELVQTFAHAERVVELRIEAVVERSVRPPAAPGSAW